MWSDPTGTLHRVSGGRLEVVRPTGHPVSGLAVLLHDQVRSVMSEALCGCLPSPDQDGLLALRPSLGSPRAGAGCAADLALLGGDARFLAVVFEGPPGAGEAEFGALLEDLARRAPVLGEVAALHAAANVPDHRFAWPTLIFRPPVKNHPSLLKTECPGKLTVPSGEAELSEKGVSCRW